MEMADSSQVWPPGPIGKLTQFVLGALVLSFLSVSLSFLFLAIPLNLKELGISWLLCCLPTESKSFRAKLPKRLYILISITGMACSLLSLKSIVTSGGTASPVSFRKVFLWLSWILVIVTRVWHEGIFLSWHDYFLVFNPGHGYSSLRTSNKWRWKFTEQIILCLIEGLPHQFEIWLAL